MKREVDPCLKKACAIQECLQAKNYQESKCENVIQAMVECCEKYGDKSNCCAGFLKGQRKKKSKDS